MDAEEETAANSTNKQQIRHIVEEAQVTFRLFTFFGF
jgi:hypothetical protein